MFLYKGPSIGDVSSKKEGGRVTFFGIFLSKKMTKKEVGGS